MKTITALATLGLLALVVSAQAAPNYSPTPPPGTHHYMPHRRGLHQSKLERAKHAG
jgi:Spy/CpxP family protein refolding chaperone